MKKIIAIILAVFLSFSIVSCKPSETDDASSIDSLVSGEVANESDSQSKDESEVAIPDSSLDSPSDKTSSASDDEPVKMTGKSELKNSSKIPAGCEYKTADGKVYKAGDKMPKKVSDGDEFTDGEYMYKYNYICNPGANGGKWITGGEKINGWGVTALNRNKKQYAEIRTSINGKDVTSIYCAFELCENLTQAPTLPKRLTDMRFAFSQCFNLQKAPQIPSTVKNMRYTFGFCEKIKDAPKTPKSAVDMSFTYTGCISLEKAADIPDGVKKIDGTFSGCTTLKSAGKIPESVTSMEGTFLGCISLTGEIVIDAKAENYSNMFADTEQMITISGESNYLDAIAKTAQPENVVVKK